MNTINTGYKWAFLTALISGLAIFFNSLLIKGIDPLVHTTIKNTFVALLIIGLILFTKEWRRLKTLTAKQWTYLISIGLIGGSLPFIFFFTGLKHIGAAQGTMIHKTLVLWVLVLAIPFLHEKVSPKLIAGIGLLYLSNFFVGFTGFSDLGFYHLLILLATILWAVENIIAKKALIDLPPNLVVAARMILGSLVLISTLLISGKGPLVAQLQPTQWLMLAAVALLLFAYVFSWYRALKFAPATHVASILVSATIITNLLNSIFITHAISLNHLAQSVSIIAGILLVLMAAMDLWRNGDSHQSADRQQPAISG